MKAGAFGSRWFCEWSWQPIGMASMLRAKNVDRVHWAPQICWTYFVDGIVGLVIDPDRAEAAIRTMEVVIDGRISRHRHNRTFLM
jgi:hypothetical protein